jgi:hypothetical protein
VDDVARLQAARAGGHRLADADGPLGHGLGLISRRARLMAPATPAPIQRWLFAALTTASTSCCAMSP